MRIALYDKDVAGAVALAIALKRAGSEVCYCEEISDPKLSTSNIVIADPAPERTLDWLAEFRRHNPSGVLVLLSASPDILSGSFRDKCYAVTKPLQDTRDILSLIKQIMLGKTGVYEQEFKSRRSC